MDLQKTLKNHALWLSDNGGNRANLSDADLYANGVTHNGIDEGDVRGGKYHNLLVAKIKQVLERVSS